MFHSFQSSRFAYYYKDLWKKMRHRVPRHLHLSCIRASLDQAIVNIRKNIVNHETISSTNITQRNLPGNTQGVNSIQRIGKAGVHKGVNAEIVRASQNSRPSLVSIKRPQRWGFSPFQCSFCGVSFPQNYQLDRHHALIHKKRSYRQYVKPGKRSVRNPSRQTAPVGRNKYRPSGKDMAKKKKGKRSKSAQQCPRCFHWYSNKYNLRRHVLKCHRDRIPEFDKSYFAVQKSKQKHPTVSAGSPQESMTSNNETSNQNQENDHDSSRKLVCPVCMSLDFGAKEDLIRHVNVRHGLCKPLLEVCDVCGVFVACVEDLVGHLLSDHRRTHYCPACQRSFQSDSELQGHFHVGLDTMVTCSQCGYPSESQCMFNRHLKSHLTWPRHAHECLA